MLSKMGKKASGIVKTYLYVNILLMDTARIGNSNSMEKSRKVITSAGSYLVKKNDNGNYELFVIHEIWPDGKVTYCLPKGSKEKDESLEEAAIRETTEESGYSNFQIINYIGSRTYELNWDIIWIKTDHYFLSILENEQKVEQNLVEYEKKVIVDSFWIDLEKGLKMLTNENQKEHHDLVRNLLNINKI
ncbi:NUDIX domain-containing protein [Patescibacteria group bacterium]|nr:NUDIX domain-containing protein [Patescibacteria group bacterium]